MLTIENIQKLKGCKVGANGMVWKIKKQKSGCIIQTLTKEY